MTAPDFASVLAAHVWTIKSLGRRQVIMCSCGDELLPITSSSVATLADHRAHVAAALDAEVSAWLGSEAAALRNYDGAVMTNERWGEGFLAGIDYAADQLAALAQAGGGDGE